MGFRSVLQGAAMPLAVAFLFLAGQAHAQEGRPFPDDPLFEYQTPLFEGAWEISHSAPDLVVALIDSGIETSHPDLAPNLWVNAGEVPDNGLDDDQNGYIDDRNGYDFLDGDPVPEDSVGHGTIMAGIIGAVGNNGIGIAGAAWSIQLMNLKVLGADSTGLLSDFVEAIHYAVDHGADIISAGWTFEPRPGEGDFPSLKEAIELAEDEGILVVAATGNDGRDLDQDPVYPAAYPLANVVSVAAWDEGEGTMALFSNYGPATVDLAAPGDEILGTHGKGGYATLTGTSPATALVVGAAALVWSLDPSLTAPGVRSLLLAGAAEEEIPVSAGILDVSQSLSLTLSGELHFDTVVPTPEIAQPASGCSLRISVD